MKNTDRGMLQSSYKNSDMPYWDMHDGKRLCALRFLWQPNYIHLFECAFSLCACTLRPFLCLPPTYIFQFYFSFVFVSIRLRPNSNHAQSNCGTKRFRFVLLVRFDLKTELNCSNEIGCNTHNWYWVEKCLPIIGVISIFWLGFRSNYRNMAGPQIDAKVAHTHKHMRLLVNL